ncbi:MAG: N-carbamoylputrescine amidase [Rhodobacteraceae bacterium]|nr:N-carbamoylputrescine amidase [Paracoccaceae bacterium]
MTRPVTLAALQTRMDWDSRATLERTLDLAHRAAEQGAQVILPSELFETPYFCKVANPRYRDLARPAHDHPTIDTFRRFARAARVVVPVSFYEKAGEGLYNSLAVIDADGEVLGVYRKCHIPQFDGYRESDYFLPSPDGPKVWTTRYLRLGTGICWDQWFPELARSMALMGAEVLVYPTAIGSEPVLTDWDSAAQWRAAMLGHAATNLVPVMAANRIGAETDDGVTLTFYGTSFICDQRARVVAEAGREDEAIVIATLDLDQAAQDRAAWGTFQTRRPRHYARVVETPAGPPPG